MSSDIRKACKKFWTKISFFPEGERYPHNFLSFDIDITVIVDGKEHAISIHYERASQLKDIYNPTCWKFSRVKLHVKEFCKEYNRDMYRKIPIDQQEIKEPLAAEGITLKQLFEESLKLMKEKQSYCLKDFS